MVASGLRDARKRIKHPQGLLLEGAEDAAGALLPFAGYGITAVKEAFKEKGSSNRASAALYRRTMLEQTGGFDGDFFLYCEDTDLGLRAAGIETDAHGYIKVSDALQTSVPNVYALGDCNGHGGFTHTAYNDYEIVADNLLSGANRKVSDRIPIYALFTDPPLGRLGRTEAEARRDGYKILIGRMPMSDVSRAREKGETQGLMKVLVDAGSKQILGAAVLGVDGDEAVQSLVDAMYGRLPYTVVQHGVRIHPTVSELIPTMLGELAPPA